MVEEYSFPPKEIELIIGIVVFVLSIATLLLVGPNYGKSVYTADAYGLAVIFLLLSPLAIIHAGIRYGLDWWRARK